MKPRLLTSSFVVALALSDAADAPLPAEFRIFKAGLNTSTQGSVLFDAKAAAATMAAYRRHGVEIMIDLNHSAFDDAARAARADAADAMGWCGLAVRSGELWAVDVRWTDEGAARLRERKQRFVSPLFLADAKTKRVCQVVNIALTAIPATDHAYELIAADAASGAAMDPELLKKAIEALKQDDGKGALALLEEMLAAALGGAPTDGEGEGAEPPPDAGGAALAEGAAPPPAEEDPKEKAALDRLKGLTASGKLADVVPVLEGLVVRVSKLDASQAAAELDTRRELVAELVKLTVETPATAWVGKPEKRQPVKRLLDEPLDELRARVKVLALSRKEHPIEPPSGGGSDGESEFELTPIELDACKDLDAKAKARFIEIRRERRAKGAA